MNTEIINMQKELLTIEFRYHDQPEDVTNSVCRNKTITIGIFDTLEEQLRKAIKHWKSYLNTSKFAQTINSNSIIFLAILVD